MLGLTIIELLFYENHRSVWVVVIGLELLTLACPGLGLGSDYGYIIYASVTHVIVIVILILLVWRIDFRVTGLELIGVMPAVRGFSPCDVGSLWLVIIPKSKDQFMERSPMKIVQP
jgi:hypothetical protein